MLDSIYLLMKCANKEAVVKLCPSFMIKIIKAPIWLRVYFSKPDISLNTVKPRSVFI